MNKQNIKVGLIGCGHLGMIHLKLINEIARENNRLIVKGVYDINRQKSASVAEQYNIRSYESLNDILNESDILIVAASTTSHYDIAIEAMKMNKHLFIEKPVTEQGFQAKELLKINKEKKLKVQVGHVERYNPALSGLAEYEIKPRFIEAHRLSQFNPRGTDVSVIQDLMIHDIDIILSLVKDDVKNIEANGVPVISENIDIANARITFKNGCVANLTSSRISINKMRKMRIFQPNSYISIDFLNNQSEVFKLVHINENTGEKLTYPVSDSKKIVYEQPRQLENLNPIKKELEHFIDSVTFDKPVTISLEDGIKAVDIAERIITKISEEQQV